ncbi:hypothetical protein XENOCAPTIV_018321, partial [Xenoophorus captivus]
SEVKTTLSQKTTLSCEVADTKTEVKWYKDGKLLISSKTIHTESKGKSRQLVIDSVEKKDAGEYFCEAGAEKLAFKIHVEELQAQSAFFKKESVQKEVKATLSQKATLSCDVADNKTEVKWYKDGKLLTSSKTIHTESKGKNRQLVIDSVERKDAGEYFCEAGSEKLAFKIRVEETQLKSAFFNKESVQKEVNTSLSQKATLSCEVADAKTEVKWYKDGKLLTSSKSICAESKGKSRQLVIDNAERKDAGEYICEAGTEKLAFKIHVAAGFSNKESVQREVKAALSQKATLNCEVSDSKMEVKWFKDGKLLASSKGIHMESRGKTRELVIERMEKKDAGEYTCEAGSEKLGFKLQLTVKSAETKDCGTYSCQTPDDKVEFKLQVKGEPVTFKKKLENLAVEEESEVKLEVVLSKPSDEVKWMKNSVVLQPAGNIEIRVEGAKQALLFKRVTYSDRGIYSCETLDDKTQAKLTVESKNSPQ